MKFFSKAARLPICSSLVRNRWAGFTLVEALFVVGIMAILLAIAIPSWLTFAESWTLNAAQEMVFQEMQVARGQSERYTSPWQVSVRTLTTGTVQVAAHPVAVLPEQANWQTLDNRVRLLTTETTLDQVNGIFRVQFNHKGAIHGQLGRVTLTMNGRVKRCVIVSTLLGAFRKGINRPNDSNRCD